MGRIRKDHATSIKDLFLVYKQRLRAPQRSVVKEVVAVVQEILPITVSESLFTYQTHSRTVVIKAPSVVRTEILRHKKDILQRLEQRLGKQSTPTTIR